MSHARIKNFLERRANEMDGYNEEGLLKGSAHLMADNYKRPWKFIQERKHTSSKVLLTPLAVTDNIVRTAFLPVHLVTTPCLLYTHKHNKKLMNAEENNDEIKSQPKI